MSTAERGPANGSESIQRYPAGLLQITDSLICQGPDGEAAAMAALDLYDRTGELPTAAVQEPTLPGIVADRNQPSLF